MILEEETGHCLGYFDNNNYSLAMLIKLLNSQSAKRKESVKISE